MCLWYLDYLWIAKLSFDNLFTIDIKDAPTSSDLFRFNLTKNGLNYQIPLFSKGNNGWSKKK